MQKCTFDQNIVNIEALPTYHIQHVQYRSKMTIRLCKGPQYKPTQMVPWHKICTGQFHLNKYVTSTTDGGSVLLYHKMPEHFEKFIIIYT